MEALYTEKMLAPASTSARRPHAAAGPHPARGEIHSIVFAAREAGCGPQPRWRSPKLAAGHWGSPAATVAPGPQGATYAPDCRGGNYPRTAAEGPRLRWPHRRAPHEALRLTPREGRGGRRQRDGGGHHVGSAPASWAGWPDRPPAIGTANRARWQARRRWRGINGGPLDLGAGGAVVGEPARSIR